MGLLAYEEKNKIGIITMNSPPANALSSVLLQDLKKQFDEIEKSATVKVIIVKGEGKFFSAGADIKEFTTLQRSSDYEAYAENGQRLFDRIENYSIPVIAAIHGAALGGGLELAMACHMRIVTENAKLGLPELTLGIIPGFAGTQRLPRYVGSAKAYEMILSGQPINGLEAFRFGLANKVVSESELDHETTKLATQIAEKSKLTINKIMELIPFAASNQFESGALAEAKAFGEIFGSTDANEGVQAFLEKRKPNFQDK